MERIERRKEFIGRVQEELERYVVQVIEQFATPDRRGIKRLEGNVSTLRIQKNADSVLITDAVAIPLAQKDVMLTMPAYATGRRCCKLSGLRTGRSSSRASNGWSTSRTSGPSRQT